MSYADALSRLLALQRFGVRPGLTAISAALDALGNPERDFVAIHIAGSNGKGSTAAMCEAVLRRAGLHVGLYTSPHLSRFTERIRIRGEELREELVAGLVDEVLAVGPELTFFEAVTAVGFLAFSRAHVDLAVVEVGLGGRLDATAVIAKPLVCVVTGIALEHTEVLGNTLAAIAREKAGIFRRDVPAVAAARDEESRAAISDVAAQVGAPVAWLGIDFFAAAASSLLGPHQRDNAALAIAALERLPPELRPGREAFTALENVHWPGRLEKIGDDVLLDGAHNADGARALAAALPELACGRGISLVVGVVEDKDAVGLVAPLLPLVSRIVTTTPKTPRARSAESLATLLKPAAGERPVEAVPSPIDALLTARRTGDLTVVAGSLFLVGQLRAHLLGERTDPVVAQDPPARPLRELSRRTERPKICRARRWRLCFGNASKSARVDPVRLEFVIRVRSGRPVRRR